MGLPAGARAARRSGGEGGSGSRLRLIDEENSVIKVGYRADNLEMVWLKGHHLERLFELRARRPEEGDNGVSPRTTPSGSSPTVAGARRNPALDIPFMRILMVEDEKDPWRASWRNSCGLSGFVTDLCHDGNEAGFLGETEPYDAIILDLGLPGRDGLSVPEGVAQQGWTPGAGADRPWPAAREDEGLNAGADDYLTRRSRWRSWWPGVQALVRRAAGTPAPSSRLAACVSTWRLPGLVRGPHQAHRPRVPGAGLPDAAQGQGGVPQRADRPIYAQDFDRDSNTVEVFIGGSARRPTPI